MSNDLEKFTTETLAARTVVFAALAKWVKEQGDTHRAELRARLSRGSKVTAFNPQDETLTLGTASMSNPEPVAYVTDREAFEAYCRATWPDKVEVWTEVHADDEQVIEILRKHAPHLITVHSSVPKTLTERALDRAASEDVPGTERRLPPPSLTVTPAKNARTVIRSMIAATPVLRELEA
ncbi:hypothetical protein [Nocardia nova]|uniref:hypothetical protein n=1 Tax=Nocardia nova TaxID=37330 RepID=UPI0018941C9F|nr:hypothetical protein [Nocardia nova]MBF6276997.1 hypothetical protein [Nocardia nova]